MLLDAGKDVELQSFVAFHQLALSPPNSLEVRKASTRHLTAAFVEMLWMCGPKVSGLAQCDCEECRLRVVMKAGTVGDDCG